MLEPIPIPELILELIPKQIPELIPEQIPDLTPEAIQKSGPETTPGSKSAPDSESTLESTWEIAICYGNRIRIDSR